MEFANSESNGSASTTDADYLPLNCGLGNRGVLKELQMNETNKYNQLPTKVTTGTTKQTDGPSTLVSAEKNFLHESGSYATNVTGVNKSYAFVGLTEFDEATIPELPDCLNPHKGVNDAGNQNGLLFISNADTDTLTSSDNEAFVECQPFQDIEVASGDVTENSEQDSFRSAGEDPLNLTMENIPNISIDDITCDFVREQVILFREDVTPEYEPMDVDISKNSTIEGGQTNEANVTVEMLELSQLDLVANSQHAAEAAKQHIKQSKQRVEEEFGQQSALIVEDYNKDEQIGATSQHELGSTNKMVSLTRNYSKASSTNSSRSDSDESRTDISTVASVIEIRPTLVKNDDAAGLVTTEKISSGTPPPTTEEKLNITIDMTANLSTAKNSAPSSPGFPTKEFYNLSQFPRSPTAQMQIETDFILKCKYNESTQPNAATKSNPTSSKIMETKITPSSPENGSIPIVDVNVFPVEEKTPSNIMSITLDSRNPLATSPKEAIPEAIGQMTLNSTFDLAADSIISNEKRRTFNLPTEDTAEVIDRKSINETLPDAENQHTCIVTKTSPNFEHNDAMVLSNTYDTEKRRTFNLYTEFNPEITSKTPDDDSTIAVTFPITNSEKRRTFNLPTATPEAIDDNVADVNRPHTVKRLTFGLTESLQDDRDDAITDFHHSDTEKRRTFTITQKVTEATDDLVCNVNQPSSLNDPTFNIEDCASVVTDSNPIEMQRIFSVASEDTAVVANSSEFAGDNLHQSDSEKCRTFNLAPVEAVEHHSDSEVRRTVTKTSPSNLTITLNSYCVPMDVDDVVARPVIPAKSPPVPALQKRRDELGNVTQTLTAPTTSPPVPTLQKLEQQQQQAQYMEETVFRSDSPPIPTCQNRKQKCEKNTTDQFEDEFTVWSTLSKSPPVPTLQKRGKQQAASIDDDNMQTPSVLPTSRLSPPLPSTLRNRPDLKRPAIRTSCESLSVKERTHVDVENEKDETPVPSANPFQGLIGDGHVDFSDADSQINWNPSDFDFLLTKGSFNEEQTHRSSLLMKFDPLLGKPIVDNQSQHQQQQLQQEKTLGLSPTIEEDEQSLLNDNKNCAFALENNIKKPAESAKLKEGTKTEFKKPQAVKPKKHARMSVDVIKDVNIEKSFENSSLQSAEKDHLKMDEPEKKIKNEVLKSEDIDKKFKECEQREETLIKRITEKDKTISKLNGVIEAYEKAIAELISDKEQLTQCYEKKLAECQTDRDENYQHLMSLEMTFSDLHVKYEKSKEMTAQLKSNEESLVQENRKLKENLRLQEQRYDKMKNHAMQQLEIANNKLESMNKDHASELTKVKALLKKEEISSASMSAQLQQKVRENAELVKICDELINGQGS